MNRQATPAGFTLLEALVAVTLSMMALGLASRLAIPIMQHPSQAARETLDDVQAQQAWELIAAEVQWAGWEVEGRSIWMEPQFQNDRGDALWVRYVDDRYRTRPRLVEGYFTAGTDGLGQANLMWTSAGGWRQPVVRGVARFHVLQARDKAGREAPAHAPSMRGKTWVAVRIRVVFEDGSEDTRWLATQFRTIGMSDDAT